MTTSKQNNTFLLLTSLCAALCFIVIATLASDPANGVLDAFIRDGLTVGSTAPLYIMEVVSQFASTEVLLVLTLVMLLGLWLKRFRTEAKLLFVVMGGGVILNLLLKFAFQRARPGDSVHTLQLFGADLDLVSFSFPSGHAMRAFLFYSFLMYIASLWLHNRFVKTIIYASLVLLIIFIGVSRIVMEAHFPSDILAAYSASLSWLCLCILVVKRKVLHKG